MIILFSRLVTCATLFCYYCWKCSSNVVLIDCVAPVYKDQWRIIFTIHWIYSFADILKHYFQKTVVYRLFFQYFWMSWLSWMTTIWKSRTNEAIKKHDEFSGYIFFSYFVESCSDEKSTPILHYPKIHITIHSIFYIFNGWMKWETIRFAVSRVTYQCEKKHF